MSKTSPDPQIASEESERLTRRQRRIEEQRRQIEALRSEQRRKRAVWGSAILVALVAVASLSFFLFRPPTAAQGRQVLTEEPQHVQPGTPITYRSRPPSSGTHYPLPHSGYGVIEREIEPGRWVHTLEHGAIVVLYRPDLCNPECLNELRQVYESAPPSPQTGKKKMAVIPYRDMDRAIAAVAWGWVDEMDQVDRDRILAFYRAHAERVGPEPNAE
jgi:hypothetical protein